MLHACDPDADPTQAAPPLDGAGLLQTRVRDWVPLAQGLVQADQADQAPQLPLTEKKDNFEFLIFPRIESPCHLNYKKYALLLTIMFLNLSELFL